MPQEIITVKWRLSRTLCVGGRTREGRFGSCTRSGLNAWDALPKRRGVKSHADSVPGTMCVDTSNPTPHPSLTSLLSGGRPAQSWGESFRNQCKDGCCAVRLGELEFGCEGT